MPMSMSGTNWYDFLCALGAWQAGWKEEKDRRIAITADLLAAIACQSAPLPTEALQTPPTCYRKRFLVPNNPQNGGDLCPFFWDGMIDEGVASWTTDYDYCKTMFKRDLRQGTIACIFRRHPAPSEVILNIRALWTNDLFRTAAESYVERKSENFQAIMHFGNTQSEVILDAPLTMDDVVAFCGQVPSLDELCTTAGITEPEDEDELWQKLVAANFLPTQNYWLEEEAAQHALNNAIGVAKQRFEKWLKPKSLDTYVHRPDTASSPTTKTR